VGLKVKRCANNDWAYCGKIRAGTHSRVQDSARDVEGTRERVCEELTANWIALRQQLNAITLGPDDTVQTYVSHVPNTAAGLRSVGVDFSDADEVDVLIMNLPESWGHVALSLMIRPGDLKVQDVVRVLLEEETRRRHADAQAITSSALVARTGAGGRRGVPGGGNGGSGTGSEGRKCYRCGQRGHIAVKCPAPQPTVLLENAAIAVVPQAGVDTFSGLYAL
jgi:hypothetical protein